MEENIEKSLIAETQEFWGNYYPTDISDSNAYEILTNLQSFYNVLKSCKNTLKQEENV